MTTKIPGSLIQSNSVADTQLDSNSVGSDELKDNAVIESKYADLSIPTAAYKLVSVTASILADDSVTSSKIGDNAILSNHYGTQSIPSTAYQLLSVGTGALGDAAVTQIKLANLSVGTSQLINDGVTRDKVGPNAIGTTEIEDYKITPAKMEKGTQGDVLVATGSDGSFARLTGGEDGSVFSMQGGIPAWTNNILPTGAMMDYAGQTSPSGWVLCNGRSIGSASSGATGRANADTEELFLFLWANFSNSELAVSSGRGASAAADWAANKTIALPDLRGRATVGRDSMEASATNRVTITSASAGGDTMGASGGTETHTLTEAQIPAHKHFTMTDNGVDEDLDISGSASWPSATLSIHRRGTGSDRNYILFADGSRPSLIPTKSPTSTIGSGNAHPNMQPFMIVSKIIKL